VPDEVTVWNTSLEGVADVVNELGLPPWRPPEPLGPIEEDEANLVVWMGVMEAET